MDRVDAAVIGAGVIGLAVARSLARAGLDTIILERGRRFGTGVSSRSSEVIHAGIYYATGSLKARFCVEGKHRLYEYCETRRIPFRRCGKIIVAAEDARIGALEALTATAAANGVDDLTYLSREMLRTLEPALVGAAGLISPTTGIIDSHAYMLSLLGEAEDHGAAIAYEAEVSRIAPKPGGFELSIAGDASTRLLARNVVNAAGLDSPGLARRIEGLSPESVPEPRYAKGTYFGLAARAPFSRLIYPLPEPGGLGIHLTLDLAGQARFGPDVEWIGAPDYVVDPRRTDKFYAAIRKYWPGLPDHALVPAYAGVRPKISGPSDPASDFVIHDAGVDGLPGLINLFGIESPGLTSSLAIADYVTALLQSRDRASR